MDITKETPTVSATIQGLAFTIPAPFAEGHVVTANEAAVLNQTLAENIRNNFADKVKKAQKDAGEGDPDVAALQTQLDEYIAGYEFGVRRGGGASLDPVEREAQSMAWDRVRGALQAKGVKLKDVTAEQKATFIDQVLNKYPDIRTEAAAIVKRRNKVANIELDGLDG